MPVIRKRTMPYLSAAFKGKNIPRNPNLSAVSEVDKSLVRELMEDDIDVELVKKEIEELADAHDFLPLTWNEHLLHFLHSLPLEIFIIVLIAIDLCLVLCTMILEVYVDEETLVESQQMSEEFVKYLELLGSTNSCYPIHSSVLTSLGDVDSAHAAISSILAQATASELQDGRTVATYLLTDSTSHSRRKRSGSTSSTSDTSAGLSLPVEDSIGKTLEEVIHGLHYLSIAILALLVLEAVVKIAAHGKHIFKNKMEIMDAVVNIASLVIDIMLTDMSTVGAIGKVLVILTLIWRVFRILNAIVITSRARYKFRIRMLKKTKQMLDAKVQSLEKNITRAQHEIGRLCQVATFYGAPQYEVRVYAEFAEEEKTTRYGIQESLMQLLRVNDAIVGHPFNRRTKEAEPNEAVARQRRSSSLPDVSTFDATLHSTTASGSPRARSASTVYGDTECGETAAARLAASAGSNDLSSSGDDGDCGDSTLDHHEENACDAPPPPPPPPLLRRRRKSWPIAAVAAAVPNHQVATRRSRLALDRPAENGGESHAVAESCKSPKKGQESARLGGCPVPAAAAAETLVSEAAQPETVLVTVESRRPTASADDCRADLDTFGGEAAFISGLDRCDGFRATDSVATLPLAAAAAAEFASIQSNRSSVPVPTPFARPRLATPAAERRTDTVEGPLSHSQRSRDSGKSLLCDGGDGQDVASVAHGRTIGDLSVDDAPSDGKVTDAAAGKAAAEPRRASGSGGEWSCL